MKSQNVNAEHVIDCIRGIEEDYAHGREAFAIGLEFETAGRVVTQDLPTAGDQTTFERPGQSDRVIAD